MKNFGFVSKRKVAKEIETIYNTKGHDVFDSGGCSALNSLCSSLNIRPNHLKSSLVNGEYKKTRSGAVKIIGLAILLMFVAVVGMLFAGCNEAERVSYNLSKEADNFNIVRQLTVTNCIEGDVLFQMTGKLSITADMADNQLEIIVEDDGTYVKHFVGLSDNVTYIVEDLNLGDNAVNKYKYTLNFNPKMWLPVEVETID